MMLNIGSNAAVCDENKPEQPAEQLQVLSSMEDKASVRKADEDSPASVAEKGGVGKYDHQTKMGDVEVLAPKDSINVASQNHQKAKSMRRANDA